jgi:phosphoserine phosphatase
MTSYSKQQKEQIDFIKQQVSKRIEFYEKKNEQHTLAAFWDLDGTIINGDITEGRHLGLDSDYSGLFERAVLQGLIPQFKGNKGLKEFRAQYYNQKTIEKSYVYIAVCLDKLQAPEKEVLKSFVKASMRDHFGQYLYDFSKELICEFEQLGVLNHVISASPHLFVQELAEILPIPQERLFGIDYHLIVSGKDPIIHHGKGKVERLEFIVEQAPRYKKIVPVFAAGNSLISDGPMINKVCSLDGIGLILHAADDDTSNIHHRALRMVL